MPTKPTIAEFRALATVLDEQHPDLDPEGIVVLLAEAADPHLDPWTMRRITQEIRIVRRQREKGREQPARVAELAEQFRV